MSVIKSSQDEVPIFYCSIWLNAFKAFVSVVLGISDLKSMFFLTQLRYISTHVSLAESKDVVNVNTSQLEKTKV